MLFDYLSRLMGDGEQVMFTISKDGGDRLCVSVQPMLAQGPGNPSGAIQQMRAGLAMPLIVRASAQELDGPGFMTALEEYTNSRLPVADGLASALARVRDGLKGAHNASIEQAATAHKSAETNGGGGSSSDVEKPPFASESENPDSLF